MAIKNRLRINEYKIDWTNLDSHYLFNPQQSSAKKLKELAPRLPFFPGHIYLLTSGGKKVCLLSKSAFLTSAQTVNKNLQTQAKDKWLISLPLFHVAGLSILARSFCGKFSYEKSLPKWKVEHFQKELKEKNIQFCSLVPTQVYDLIQKNLKAPKQLKALIVGGATLSPFIYKKAKNLGWPILISYGMTETCSQIACSSLKSLNKTTFPKMKLLDHIKIKTIRNTHIKIKTKSLLTAYFDLSSKTLQNPKDSKGWFQLKDELIIKRKFLFPKGRKDEQIKILGEAVHLQKLSFLLEKLSLELSKTSCLIALPDLRQGYQIALVTSSFEMSKIFKIIKAFNKKVLPFEKINSLYFINEIPKSVLFKMKQNNLRKKIFIPDSSI